MVHLISPHHEGQQYCEVMGMMFAYELLMEPH